MTTTLTPTEQQAVKDAAKYLSRHYNFANDRILIEESFEAGIKHALSTLFEPRCVAFTKWVDEHYKQGVLNSDTWFNVATGNTHTTSELYSIYNEQLNKQQDEPV